MHAGTNDKYKGKAERTECSHKHDMRYNSGMRLTARLISVDGMWEEWKKNLVRCGLTKPLLKIKMIE